MYEGKTGEGCDGFHPKVPLDLGEIVEFSEKVEQSGEWPQQACTTTIFSIPKNVTSERPIALVPTMIRWRALRERSEQAAASGCLWSGTSNYSKIGPEAGGAVLGTQTKTGVRGATHPAVGGRTTKEVQNSLGRKEGSWNAMKGFPFKNSKTSGIVSSQGVGIRFWWMSACATSLGVVVCSMSVDRIHGSGSKSRGANILSDVCVSCVLVAKTLAYMRTEGCKLRRTK